jgi:hypothetical protein
MRASGTQRGPDAAFAAFDRFGGPWEVRQSFRPPRARQMNVQDLSNASLQIDAHEWERRFTDASEMTHPNRVKSALDSHCHGR